MEWSGEEWAMAVSHPDRVAEFSVEQLTWFVEEIVSRKLTQQAQIEALDAASDEAALDHMLAELDAHLWTPSPGAMSSGELLREDRDRI